MGEKRKDPDRSPVGIRLVGLIVVIGLGFILAGTVLGVLNIKEMKQTVGRQFNAEQLVIARGIQRFVQREMDRLKGELGLLAEELRDGPADLSLWQPKVDRCFARVMAAGVWRIRLTSPDGRQVYDYLPKVPVTVHDADVPPAADAPPAGGGMDPSGKGQIRISRPRVGNGGIFMSLSTGSVAAGTGQVAFDLNLSWMLGPFIKDVRSGKSGYAWIIDDGGVFLYHPRSEFIGRDAFLARQIENPDLSYERINRIQRENMLQGIEGSGWYMSAWHRGDTGHIRKFIAYCPIHISDVPLQVWSVAVVAPVTEIEQAVQAASRRQMLMQGLVIVVIICGACALLWLEVRWSDQLGRRVVQRTDELKQSEGRYRSLVESAEDLIFVVDTRHRLRSMNSFTAAFFGGRAEDFLDKPVSAMFPAKSAAVQREIVERVRGYGKTVKEEIELPMGPHSVWLSAKYMPLKDTDGRIHSVLCIARDITENKQLERQLVNAEKLASLGTLAAGIAHEINNPISVILGFCDILIRKAPEKSQTHDDLKIIERQATQCKEVVENLLSFARFESAGTPWTAINGCIEDILRVVRHTLKINHVELITAMAADLPPVCGDTRQLQQVFLNLINNATAAMPTGGTLSVRTQLAEARDRVIIHVADTGTGIDEANMDRIFEPFFTTKPEGEGTGLGLFVSYGIIAKYGGTLTCRSSRGGNQRLPETTTFTIKLPVYSQETR
ncbi:MAG: PAS domain S-box protein [Desulfobacterales bacterium]|nr:PAS domain S-box protein [Desulfobacterales bacterium]